VIYPGVKNNTIHIPLFETDLMRAFDDSGFNYATGINNFVGAIMNIFNRMVEEVNRVPEVEQKVLLEIFKK
jgi:dynein heavy chain